MLVNVTGYSYTGKGALLAILREFENIKLMPRGKEFDLFRLNDGLIDLSQN